jgi:hypothetical protein
VGIFKSLPTSYDPRWRSEILVQAGVDHAVDQPQSSVASIDGAIRMSIYAAFNFVRLLAFLELHCQPQ